MSGHRGESNLRPGDWLAQYWFAEHAQRPATPHSWGWTDAAWEAHTFQSPATVRRKTTWKSTLYAAPYTWFNRTFITWLCAKMFTQDVKCAQCKEQTYRIVDTSEKHCFYHARFFCRFQKAIMSQEAGHDQTEKELGWALMRRTCEWCRKHN